jgi:hypothetical protein
MNSLRFACLVAAVGVATAFSATPASAQACRIGGKWELTQGNRFVVKLDIVQIGRHLYGSGSYGRTSGTLHDGHIVGRDVSFRMEWPSGSGQYTGRIDPTGTMSGTTKDVARPFSQATWYANRRFAC